MTGNVVRLDTPMRKDKLVAHLKVEHSQAVAQVMAARRWKKYELVELHLLIHFGLGR